MSAPEHVGVAARVTVGIVAPVVTFSWILKNPANCTPDFDLYFEIAAVGALGVAIVPLALRAFRRLANDLRALLWDLAFIFGVIAILLFMHSGEGRSVIPDACGFSPGMGDVPPL